MITLNFRQNEAKLSYYYYALVNTVQEVNLVCSSQLLIWILHSKLNKVITHLLPNVSHQQMGQHYQRMDGT